MPDFINTTNYNTPGAVSGLASSTGGGLSPQLQAIRQNYINSGAGTGEQWDAAYSLMSGAFGINSQLSFAQLAAQTNYQQGNLANQQQQNTNQMMNQQQLMAYQNMSDQQKYQLELQMGNGNLALGQARLAADAAQNAAQNALGQGQLQLSQQQLQAQMAQQTAQLALDKELGEGNLHLGQANAILNAPRGPADFYAYTARMGDLANKGLLGGFLGNLIQNQTGQSLGQLASGPVLTNTQLANALVTGTGASSVPTYMTGGAPIATGAPSAPNFMNAGGQLMSWNPATQKYDAGTPLLQTPTAPQNPIGPAVAVPPTSNPTYYVPPPLVGSNVGDPGANSSGISAMAEGNYNVPEDQTALVHQGEMVLPAPIAEQVRAQPGVPSAGPIMPGLQGGTTPGTTPAPAPSSPTNAELATGIVQMSAGRPVSEAASNFLQKSIGVAPPTAASTAATSSTDNPTAPNVTSGDVQGLMTADEIAQGTVLSPDEIARRQALLNAPSTFKPMGSFDQASLNQLKILMSKASQGGQLSPAEQAQQTALLGQYQASGGSGTGAPAPTTPTTPTTPAASTSTLPAWTPGFQTSAQDWKQLTPTAQSLYLGAQQETGGETPDDFLNGILKSMPTFAKSAQGGLG